MDVRLISRRREKEDHKWTFNPHTHVETTHGSTLLCPSICLMLIYTHHYRIRINGKSQQKTITAGMNILRSKSAKDYNSGDEHPPIQSRMTIKASPARLNRDKDQSRMTIKASPARLNRDKDQSLRL